MYLVGIFDHEITTLIHAIVPSGLLAGLSVTITNDWYYIIIDYNSCNIP
jgi:hypothetical protein